MNRVEQIEAWERGDLYPDHELFSFAHGFGTGLIDDLNRAAIDRAIEVLNRVHAADPSVLPALFEHRVPCNDAVADDLSVQVRSVDDSDRCEVGLLGIINGLFGVDGRDVGFIAAYFDDEHNLTRFGWTEPPEADDP